MGTVLDKIADRLDRRAELPASTPDASEFSVKVKNLRSKLGLSQEEFCNRYGVSLANLRNWEQGRSGKPDHTARLLLEMIRVDPDRTASIVQKTRSAQLSEKAWTE